VILRRRAAFGSLTGPFATDVHQRLDLATAELALCHATWICCASVSVHQTPHEPPDAHHPHTCCPVFSEVNRCVSKETRVETVSPYCLFGFAAGSGGLPVHRTIQEDQVGVEMEEGVCNAPKWRTKEEASPEPSCRIRTNHEKEIVDTSTFLQGRKKINNDKWWSKEGTIPCAKCSALGCGSPST
jgi:hypothetical protein